MYIIDIFDDMLIYFIYVDGLSVTFFCEKLLFKFLKGA